MSTVTKWTTLWRQPADLASLLSLLVAALFVYLLVRRGIAYAGVALVVPSVGLWVIRRHGNGYLLGLVVMLVVPYFYPHVWEIAPILALVGFVAGVAKTRLRMVDLAVGALAFWLTVSWLLHPELGITTKTFFESILPLQFYLWSRLTLTEQLLPKLQWVLLLATGVAALTVLYEAARHTVVFVDPQRYQWAGNTADVFRAGGVFGGSPPAGIALAVMILASIGLLRSPGRRRLVAAVLGVMFFAMVLTYARSALVAIAGGAILAALLLPYRHWGRVALVVWALAIPGYFLSTSPGTISSLDRSKLVNSGLLRTTSNNFRLSFYGLAFPLADDTTQHLLFGRGFEAFEAHGNFDVNMADAPLLIQRGGPHDDYLRAVLEQGMIGLIFLLVWLGGSVLIGIRTCLSLPKGSDQRLLIAGLTAGVAGYMLASFFHDLTHNVPDLSIAALITGILVSVCNFYSPVTPDAT